MPKRPVRLESAPTPDPKKPTLICGMKPADFAAVITAITGLLGVIAGFLKDVLF